MRRLSSALLAATAVACSSNDPTISQPRSELSRWSLEPRYAIAALGSLGGITSVATSINQWGTVAGYSNLPGDGTRHAVLWRGENPIDLRTLGGPNSSVQWPGLDNGNMVVGISETADLDPLNEDWSCSAFFPSVTHHICRGFVWEGNEMRPLPTFGGHHGFATGINDRGQIVGWAETPLHDPTCNAPQVLQFRAALWTPRRRAMFQLRPLHGDSTSAATAINDREQAVGISGECDVAVGRFSAQHAVIWEHGSVHEIPNLGGTSWHTPMAINQLGDVVGFSNPPGDAGGVFMPHAFLWTRRGGTIDLKLLPNDAYSQAFGINDRREIVGRSCGASGCRAVLWRDGKIMDLNTRIASGPANVLTAAREINDRGVIVGNMIDAASGNVVPFTATPTGLAP